MFSTLTCFLKVLYFFKLYWYILDTYNDHIYHREFIPMHISWFFVFFLFHSTSFNPCSLPYLQRFCFHSSLLPLSFPFPFLPPYLFPFECFLPVSAYLYCILVLTPLVCHATKTMKYLNIYVWLFHLRVWSPGASLYIYQVYSSLWPLYKTPHIFFIIHWLMGIWVALWFSYYRTALL